MAEQIDYEAVLADLIAKRDELDKAIAVIQRLQGLPVSEASTAPEVTKKPESQEIKSDTFFGLPVSDAIKKYLRMVKRPRAVNAISEALLQGGTQTLSKNFYTSVYAALQREENAEGGFVKVSKKEWGLAEWYPGRVKA